MSNGEVMIIHLIVGLIRKTLYKMNQFFPKPYRNFEGDVKIELNVFNYATKSE